MSVDVNDLVQSAPATDPGHWVQAYPEKVSGALEMIGKMEQMISQMIHLCIDIISKIFMRKTKNCSRNLNKKRNRRSRSDL